MTERDKQLKSVADSWRNYKRRVATQSDKWCRQTMPKWYQDRDEDGNDIGFILTGPCQEKGTVNLGWIGGYIVRSKKIGGMLLLQVVPNKKRPEYSIVFYENGIPSRSRINIKCETKGWRWPW